MTNRHFLDFTLLAPTVDNMGELAAEWWHTAEVNRPPDEHGRFSAEVVAKLEQRRTG